VQISALPTQDESIIVNESAKRIEVNVGKSATTQKWTFTKFLKEVENQNSKAKKRKK